MGDLYDAAMRCGDKMFAKYLARLDPKDINKRMGDTGLLKRRWTFLCERVTPLTYIHQHTACFLWNSKKTECVALFDLLIEKGANIACSRLLESCVVYGDLPLFQRILATGELKPYQLHSVLKEASSHDRVEMAGLLIDHGADPNHDYSSSWYKVALDEARSPEMIRLLVSRGANVAFRYQDGSSLFESYHCDAAKARLLLELSGDAHPTALINSPDPRSGKTLLYQKLKSFDFEELDGGRRHFIWSSEDEDDFDRRLESYKEDHQKQLDYIRDLVRMGADPLIKTNKGKTCRDLGPRVCAFLDSV